MRALARVEGSRLIRHPLFLALTAITLPGLAFTEGSLPNLRDSFVLPLLFFPMAGGALLATNLAVLRPERHDAVEQLEAASLSQRARTGAHLLSIWYAVGVALVVLLVWIVVQRRFGALGWPDLAEALTGPLLVGGGGVIGVMVGRWVASPLAAVPAMAIVGVVEATIASMGSETQPVRWLAPWAGANLGLPRDAWPRPTLAHLVYLGSLVALLAVLALARHGGSRRMAIAAVAALGVGLSAAWVQTRPPADAVIAAAARYLEHPDEVQRCREREGVRFCIYPGYEQLIEQWAEAVLPVVHALPPDERARSLVVSARVSAEQLRNVPPEVQPLLRADPDRWPYIDPADDAIHPGLSWGSRAWTTTDLSLSLAVAVRAVGLPLNAGIEPATAADVAGSESGVAVGDPIRRSCFARGQARAVMALWLAAQAAPGDVAPLAGAFNDDPDDGINSFTPGVDRPVDLSRDALVHIDPPPWINTIPSGVRWSLSDVRYAVALLEQPAQRVRAALHAHWTELTDRATPTAVLVRRLGLTLLPERLRTVPETGGGAPPAGACR